MLIVTLICSVILITCSPCRSQTTIKPSTLVENEKLREAIRQIEMGKIYAERATQYRILIDTLNARIAILNYRISEMTSKDTATAHVLQTYKDEVANLVQQRDLAAATVKKQNKLYRRQKRKTVFVAIAGPAVTAAVFLYLKK